MELTNDSQRGRLAYLRKALDTFPESVVPVSYALSGPPPLAPLGALLARPNPILEKFVERLKAVRPDLTEGALLSLQVPVAAGDQEVYTARLGKWLFEEKMLGRLLAE